MFPLAIAESKETKIEQQPTLAAIATSFWGIIAVTTTTLAALKTALATTITTVVVAIAVQGQVIVPVALAAINQQLQQYYSDTKTYLNLEHDEIRLDH
jgi:uncharacterized membrane protein YccF (DUF307 family)